MGSESFNFRQVVTIMPAVAGCLLLSACFHMPSLTPPAAPVFDIRSASVVSGTRASPQLLANISDRVNAAIAATPHRDSMPAVTLTVRVTPSESMQGYEKNRNTARVDVDASAIDTGSVVYVSSFESTTFSADATAIDDLMAEDIAARIRSSYSLTTPRLVN